AGRPCVVDKPARVEELVAPDGAASAASALATQQPEGGGAFGRARGVCDGGAHDQAGSILHQRVGEIAETGFGARRLLIETGIGVSARGVRVIGARRPTKIHGRIAALAGRRRRLVLGPKTFVT